MIKPKEIIFSITIAAIMIIAGFFIGNKIHQKQIEQYQQYDTAVQIDSQDLFLYGMKTNIGNAFVYGQLEALDPVCFPEFNGEYSYIKREKQKYTKHYRTVEKEYTDSNGNKHTRTVQEEYWTWDTVKTDVEMSTKISFLEIEFAYSKIIFPSPHHLATVRTGYHTRNVYYGTGTSFTGTIFTNLESNTIANKTKFYNNQTISETIDNLESGYQLIIFWIAWIVLTAGLVVGFCYLENKWLD